MKLEKRFSHGLQFMTSYVWSHALANSGTPLSGSSNLAPISQTDWATAYSTASWDIRHSMTTNFNYELPLGRGKKFGGNMNRAADAIAGGWQVNGILTLRTGSSHPRWRAPVVTAFGAAACPITLPDIPEMANSAPAGRTHPNEYFDINAYTVAYSSQAAGIATGGNVGLQTITGAPTKTLDFSIFKSMRITERFRVQFRAEALNLTNHTVFSQPDVSLGDSRALGGNGNFGVITSSVAGTERRATLPAARILIGPIRPA